MLDFPSLTNAISSFFALIKPADLSNDDVGAVSDTEVSGMVEDLFSDIMLVVTREVKEK